MRPYNPPPLGNEIPNLRECSRDLDFPNGVACAKPPFLHLCWTVEPEMECGFVCEGHARELTQKGWNAIQSHEVGPDCGMPGSLWDFRNNRCFVPEDTDETTTEVTIKESVPA
jgi:hypothetical protein